jgi:hypothetical protein
MSQMARHSHKKNHDGGRRQKKKTTTMILAHKMQKLQTGRNCELILKDSRDVAAGAMLQLFLQGFLDSSPASAGSFHCRGSDEVTPFRYVSTKIIATFSARSDQATNNTSCRSSIIIPLDFTSSNFFSLIPASRTT